MIGSVDGLKRSSTGALASSGSCSDFHLVAHFQAGLVHVGAPGELEHDVALAGARDRLELAQALDHADGFFDRLG